MVAEPSRWSGSGLGTLAEVRKWSRDPIDGPELVSRPARWTLSGMETILEVRS